MRKVGRFSNLGEIHSKLIIQLRKDEDIQKLLLNDNKNPLKTEVSAEKLSKIGGYIGYNPKISENDNIMSNYIICSIDKISSVAKNNEFKSIQVRFDVICNFEQWAINDIAPRPYLIMNRIDELFNGAEISSIGTLEYVDAVRLVISSELGGYSLVYETRDFN